MSIQERRKRKAKIKLFNGAKVFARKDKSAKEFEKFAQSFMKDEIAIVGDSGFQKMLDLFFKT